MKKQNELNLEAIGMADLVKPLSREELVEIDGGSRENKKQAGGFQALYNFIVGGSSAGSVGGAVATL